MKQTGFKNITLLFCLITVGLFAQKQTKTFTENFNVNKDAVLDLNTSNADIEFETWSKNQIEIEVVMEIEGISKEEAEKYFEKNKVKVLGNSSLVEVSTGNSFSFEYHAPTVARVPHAMNLSSSFNFPRRAYAINVDSLSFANVPALKSITSPTFDYKVYKKDGEKYLAKWQKEFEKDFDKKKVKELRKWAMEMAQHSKKIAAEGKKIAEEHAKMLKEKDLLILENHFNVEEKAKMVNELKGKLHSIRNSDDVLIYKADTLHMNHPNTFYLSSKGKDVHFKVKRTIKIKMPKSATIKMNVRHGDVKLAENTTNIKANLSYASLLASTIDGSNTVVNASYSPITVNRWNLGQLTADYADRIKLNVVKDLKLNSVSSMVEIDELLDSAFIHSDLGRVQVNNISNNFSTIDVTLQNGELDFILPKTPYTIYVNGTHSELVSPANLKLSRAKNLNTTIHKGYNISKNTNKSININSKYSEVVLK